MAKNDYIIDSDSDLLIQNGDFVIDNAELIHAISILKSAKGEIRQFPLLGANLDSLIGSKIDSNILFNLAKQELINDDIILKNIEVTNTLNDYSIKIEL